MALRLQQRPSLARVPAKRSALRVACSASKQESNIALPVATMVAAAVLASSMCPDEALAARSGGRVGGGGFSRSSASRSAISSSTTVSNVTVYSAPPVVVAPMGGYGFGYGFMPSFPIFMPFGGLFQVFALMLVLGVIFNVIRGIADAANSANGGKKDDWGDL